MKKQLMLILILTQMSTNALAEWSWFSGDENAGMYVELSTLRKTGSKVKIWTLNNTKTPQEIAKGKFLSAKLFFEFDCKETNVRTLAGSFFSQNMGAGEVISSQHFPNSEWTPVTPGSIGQELWSVTCEENATEWTAMGESNEVKNGLRAYPYVDFGTVTKVGEVAKIWYLADLRSVDPSTQFKNSSVKMLFEINCKNAQFRYIEMLAFTGNMGLGTKTRRPEEHREWEPIAIGSLNSSISVMACSSK